MKKSFNCKVILVIFLLIANANKTCEAHGEEALLPFMINSFIGYQYGFGNKTHHIKNTFDADLVLAFLNGGYSYNKDYGSNAYVGIGLFSILQFQYGYAYSQKQNLFRIRTDIPLTTDIIGGNAHFWNAFNVGIYYEKRFKNISLSNNFGFNVSVGFMNIIQIIEEKKEKKKKQK